MEPIRVSVIIPTLTAGPGFENILKRLKEQKLPVQEILVIDSGSADDTVKIARSHNAHLIEIEQEKFDHGGTRNLGAAETRGDILIYMTQDAIPANDRLTEFLTEPFHDSQVAVSYARQVAAPGAAVSETYLRLANYPEHSQVRTKAAIVSLGIKAFRNSNVCAAYRRQVFEELGGFPEPAVCNEDMLFAARAILSGHSVVYCADAIVQHTHSYSPVMLFKRYFDIGASLHLQPEIEALGQTGRKGREFLNGYLQYLKQEKKLHYLPLAAVETISRYCGFALGRRHRKLPARLRKHLSMNKEYWSRIRRNEDCSVTDVDK